MLRLLALAKPKIKKAVVVSMALAFVEFTLLASASSSLLARDIFFSSPAAKKQKNKMLPAFMDAVFYLFHRLSSLVWNSTDYGVGSGRCFRGQVWSPVFPDSFFFSPGPRRAFEWKMTHFHWTQHAYGHTASRHEQRHRTGNIVQL